MESAGVVVNVPGHDLWVGGETRLWLDHEGKSLRFQASVLRLGVAVPDRGPHGTLLGFLKPLEKAPALEPGQQGAPHLTVALPGGSEIDLTRPPVQLIGVDINHLEFEVPADFTVMFPENGVLTLRLGDHGEVPHVVRARVERVVRGDAHLVYGITLEQVEDRARHHRAVRALRTVLGL